MELIDREDLIINILTNDFINKEYDIDKVIYNIDKDILNAPTIEAIPIDWIQQYLNKQYEIHSLPVQVDEFIIDMIDEWRKENN